MYSSVAGWVNRLSSRGVAVVFFNVCEALPAMFSSVTICFSVAPSGTWCTTYHTTRPLSRSCVMLDSVSTTRYVLPLMMLRPSAALVLLSA